MVVLQNYFSASDYVVFIGMLVISMGIGVFFAIRGDRQRTQGEYLMGGRSMSLIPVAISISVSFLSAIMMLGTPAEIYTQGVEIFLGFIGGSIGFILAGLLFVPLFYPLGITSVFEYLERRFKSRGVRLLGTFINITNQVIYMGIASYAPSTALEAVTGFPVWGTILTIGVVTTFYTTIGGMKAVVWTDVFQGCVMFAGILSIAIQGTMRAGGLARVWEVNEQWGRSELFTWSLDPRVRHTVWGLTVGSALSWIGVTGLSQAAVQRYCSLPTLRQAQASVFLNVLATFILFSLTCAAGLVMFAYYADQNCDLLSQRVVDNPNQLIPYFVMEILAYPTIPGLFMSSVFSGALSSLSSSMNSLAAVTWEDCLKPFYGSRLSDAQQTFLLKVLVAFYGALAVAMSFVTTYLEGTVLQAALSFQGPTGGALSTLFILGAFFPFANKYGAFAGGVVGLVIGMWRALGSYITGLEFKILPYPNGTCFDANSSSVAATTAIPELFTENSTTTLSYLTTTAAAVPHQKTTVEEFYSISYLWSAGITIVIGVTTGLLVSLATRHWTTKEERDVPTTYQIPLFTRVLGCLPESWLYYLDCCRTFEKPEDIKEQIELEISEPLATDQLSFQMKEASMISNGMSNGLYKTTYMHKDAAGVDNQAFQH